MMRHFLHFLTLAALVGLPLLAQAAQPDVNGDGVVDVADINVVVNTMLASDSNAAADVNGDGSVDVGDLNVVVNTMLDPGQDFDPDLCPDGHHPHWIDLGLPSGTLWACCNVGAITPIGYGNYYAWGETEPKAVYSRGKYKWYKEGRYDENGDYHYGGYTKYISQGPYLEGYLDKPQFKSEFGYEGFVDNKPELDLDDDAAYVNWGSGCRMPSIDQIYELFNNCTSEWVTRNGVKGRVFKSRHNGASFFLPAAGYYSGSEIFQKGSGGSYWSRTLVWDLPCYVWCMDVDSSGAYCYGWYRPEGRSVRAVRVPQN